ncbi:hypothetical protein OLZ31_26665, partial [Enterobacter asburiae]|nr:hypothetical protein [Enterobacter asburiae]
PDARNKLNAAPNWLKRSGVYIHKPVTKPLIPFQAQRDGLVVDCRINALIWHPGITPIFGLIFHLWS